MIDGAESGRAPARAARSAEVRSRRRDWRRGDQAGRGRSAAHLFHTVRQNRVTKWSAHQPFANGSLRIIFWGRGRPIRDPVRARPCPQWIRRRQMNSGAERYTGGCLCGALRYEVFGESIGSGHCYCVDCRRASGSGFIPFMGFKAEAVRFTGEASQFRSKAANGNDAVRNRCAQCMSLVFGGEIGKTELVHDLRRLARRSLRLPSDLRHLC